MAARNGIVVEIYVQEIHYLLLIHNYILVVVQLREIWEIIVRCTVVKIMLIVVNNMLRVIYVLTVN